MSTWLTKGARFPSKANGAELVRWSLLRRFEVNNHPGGNPGENVKSTTHRCHPILVAFVWELTKETINLPLGCLQEEMKRRPGARSAPRRAIRVLPAAWRFEVNKEEENHPGDNIRANGTSQKWITP